MSLTVQTARETFREKNKSLREEEVGRGRRGEKGERSEKRAFQLLFSMVHSAKPGNPGRLAAD